ncbi:MAG TPA: hypothetical protein VN028_09780 [Rhodocyclaceae bacterium]|nr:hypothetical protein [Rhodocyclaceae bacterium]
MKLKLALAAATVLLSTAAVPALAQTPPATPHIDQREQHQENRIQQGEQSGALSDKEAAHLEKGQAHLDRMESRAKADGKVSHKERAHLRHAERVQSRHIARAKHD